MTRSSPSKALGYALVAGLVSGSMTLAEEVSVKSPSPSGSPSPKAAPRKPHKDIKNKMNCCKGGCECMPEKKAGSP